MRHKLFSITLFLLFSAAFSFTVGCGGGGGTVTPPSETDPPTWDADIGITDVVAGDKQVTVHWGTATDTKTPPVKYLIYKDNDSNPWDQDPIIRDSNDPYTFTGLINSQTYWFGVRCQDGVSPPNTDSNTKVLSAVPDKPFEPWDGVIAFRSADASDYNKSRLWFITSEGEQLIDDDANWYGSIRWSPNGELLVYRNISYNLVMVSKDGVVMHEFGEADDQISWSNDSQYVLSGVYFDGLYKYGIDGSYERLLISADETYDHNPVQSKDGEWIYFLHHEWETHCKIYRIKTEKLLASASYADCEEVIEITTSAISRDEGVFLEPTPSGVIIIGYDDVVGLLDPETGILDTVLHDSPSYIKLSPNGQYLAITDYSVGVVIYNTSSWKAIERITSDFWIRTFTWSQDSQAIALGGHDYDADLDYWVARVYIWRFSDPRCQKVFDIKADQRNGSYAFGEQTVAISWNG